MSDSMIFPLDKFRELETPFYYYDRRVLGATLEEIRRHIDRNPAFNVHYAVKANANPEVLKLAGYAGGITSAAMDGIRVAEKIIGREEQENG